MQSIYLTSIFTFLFLGVHSDNSKIFFQKHSKEKIEQIYNHHLTPYLKPFYHGVASGDPLSSQVIIWTKVFPEKNDANPIVRWKMASDVAMEKIVQIGEFMTNAERDFTVKIDVKNLLSDTYYYYQFEYKNKKSIIGRTKTAPKNVDSEHLRFGVVSCNNFQHGYYNAYHHLSERNDLDAILHLGDYIYEYADGKYAANSLKGKRQLLPQNEIITLEDYRMRYDFYRLDTNLMKVHQQHPFICIWDDHEVADDAHAKGAGNHQKREGSYLTRKEAAKQAYFEWLPIRNVNKKSIYRNFNYGNLAEVILLDTRHEARSEPADDLENAKQDNRTILGNIQKNWFKDALKDSNAKWKIIGQQVVFSELNIGWANPIAPTKTEQAFLDIWDGFVAERNEMIDFIDTAKIENVVFLAGDFHCSFAFEVAKNPTQLPYKPVAIEFATPSISSANVNEFLSNKKTSSIENCLTQDCDYFPFYTDVDPNPHLKFTDLNEHGYLILDITEERIQSEWYFVKTILKPQSEEYLATTWSSESGSNRIKSIRNINQKERQASPAPTFRSRKYTNALLAKNIKNEYEK